MMMAVGVAWRVFVLSLVADEEVDDADGHAEAQGCHSHTDEQDSHHFLALVVLQVGRQATRVHLGNVEEMREIRSRSGIM